MAASTTRWRVRWRDGPTRRVLMDRAAALGRFRVGSPLPFEQLRFTRSDSAVALAGTIAQKVRRLRAGSRSRSCPLRTPRSA